MTIPALGIDTGQACSGRSLGMFKINKAEDGLGFLAIDSGAQRLLHGLCLRATKPWSDVQPFSSVLFVRNPTGTRTTRLVSGASKFGRS
jgi:hypothetical protein